MKGFSGVRLDCILRVKDESVNGLLFRQFWLLSRLVDRSIKRMSLDS